MMTLRISSSLPPTSTLLFSNLEPTLLKVVSPVLLVDEATTIVVLVFQSGSSTSTHLLELSFLQYSAASDILVANSWVGAVTIKLGETLVAPKA